MKPKLIILIRHGQSEGNADKSLLETKPDYKLNLTDEGIEQAKQAGQEVKKIIGEESLQVYVSPYYRTRQTYQHIQECIRENIVKAFEDPRIREQDWGHLRNPGINEEIIQERNGFSTFYCIAFSMQHQSLSAVLSHENFSRCFFPFSIN